MSEGQRVESVDRLRGVVMVLMALDHARDFLSAARFPPENLAHTTVPLFLTRWITHYCAPTFFLLAGMGIGIAAARGRPRRRLAAFLATRGLWLIVIELTVVRFAWTFNFDYLRFTALQVIWALGCSMILLAGLIFLPRAALAGLAVLSIAAHNLLDGIGTSGAGLQTADGPTLIGAPLSDWLWAIVHVQQPPVIYPLIPWAGVMAGGYVLGFWVLLSPKLRRLSFVALGVTLSLLFVILRWLNEYGDPQPWTAQATPVLTWLSFLSVNKYPPSLLFLLMTLGPALAVLPLFERLHGTVGGVLTVFGRVPFFFYVAHLYVVHALSVVVGLLQGHSLAEMCNIFFVYPQGYGIGLPGVYLAWAAIVVALYPVCRQFAEIKAQRRDWWLSYL